MIATLFASMAAFIATNTDDLFINMLLFSAATDKKQIFVTGHSEYDQDTLAKEYFRDVDAGLPIEVPENYFPDNNHENIPPVTWRSHANLLFSNWLNYYVYQTTPYDIKSIGE